jgi:hypothetical protein
MNHWRFMLMTLIAPACASLPTGCAGSLDGDFSATSAALPAQRASAGKAGSSRQAHDAATPQLPSRSEDPDAASDVDAGPSSAGLAAHTGAGSGGAWSRAAASAADSGRDPAGAAACDFRGHLTSASLAMRLEGRKGASACTDKLLIDKQSPEDSMLYLKVTGTSCGLKMPLGGSLTATEQACMLDWIGSL